MQDDGKFDLMNFILLPINISVAYIGHTEISVFVKQILRKMLKCPNID